MRLRATFQRLIATPAVTLSVLLAASLALPAPSRAGDTPVAVEVEGSERPTAPAEGMRIYVDPETGALVPTPPAAARRELEERRERADRAREERPRVRRAPSGATILEGVEAEMNAEVAPSGEVRARCGEPKSPPLLPEGDRP
jgi:phosphoenolpyruvate-protein kinase (PTS system EI component)